ncbi:MAG: DUF2202 domain-containing protein [Eubacteriales bacterium]|nr:DUF2202 domain-containing protein [Eubacteriales bacterium]
MKTNKSLTISSRNLVAVLVIIALSFSCIVILSGCSNTSETFNETTMPVQKTTEEVSVVVGSPTLDAVIHNVDMYPTPLTADDEALSLEGYGAAGALADQSLSINDMLMYAVQDEYLARGEYLSIIDKFGDQRPYSNIIKSEETHLAFLEEVYLTYDLKFPEDSSLDHIVVPGDLLEAAQTGVQAEIDNIAMYEIFLTYDLPENVFEVFTALKKGSESHLLAFQKQVDKLD